MNLQVDSRSAINLTDSWRPTYGGSVVAFPTPREPEYVSRFEDTTAEPTGDDLAISAAESSIAGLFRALLPIEPLIVGFRFRDSLFAGVASDASHGVSRWSVHPRFVAMRFVHA
jgi:hypothetical protein